MSGSTGTTGTGSGSTGAGLNLGTESSLSNWAGEYVTDTLGKGQALGGLGYEAYKGPLTAGTSTLQNNAMQGLASLTAPTGVSDAAKTAGSAATAAGNLSYNPTTFTSGTFDTNAFKNYLDTYLPIELQPQIDEAKRQAAINRLASSAALTKAGAYGGSSRVLLDTESQRNLNDNIAKITGNWYGNAHDKAMSQFNADQNRALDVSKATEASKQFGANYDLSALNKELEAAQMQSNLSTQDLTNKMNLNNALMNAGNTQRNITQAGYDAAKAQFDEEKMYPYKQVQFLQSLLSGLPLESQQNTYSTPSLLSEALGGAGTFLDILNKISPSTKE